jgi:RNA polymerase sigma factor (sigma-70 family)
MSVARSAAINILLRTDSCLAGRTRLDGTHRPIPLRVDQNDACPGAFPKKILDFLLDFPPFGTLLDKRGSSRYPDSESNEKTMGTPDIALIEKSRRGDRDAFGQIVRQYQGIVSGVIYGILGDFHKSEDIAQETFLIAWKKLDELREVEKLPGWLCGIARNLANHYRVRQPKIQPVSLTEAAEIAGQKDDPARIFAQSEQNQLIWAALEKIPEKYRIPLVLYYRSEKSLSEIADALELSKDVLSMRLTRARKYLRRELEKQVEGAIAANGPGEFFSLAVIAALPTLAAISTAGKAVAGTAIGTETTFAASSMVVPQKWGLTGTALFGTSLFGMYVASVLNLVSLTFFCLFFMLAAVPGIWFSVRNSPTLRTRRYLILCSLRAHLLIAFFAFLVWAFFPSYRAIHALVQYCGIEISGETAWTYIFKQTFGRRATKRKRRF